MQASIHRARLTPKRAPRQDVMLPLQRCICYGERPTDASKRSAADEKLLQQSAEVQRLMQRQLRLAAAAAADLLSDAELMDAMESVQRVLNDTRSHRADVVQDLGVLQR